MRIYSGKTTLEAARDRIRWIMSEFENVLVSFSGGKDSTVVLELTLEVAREMGRLPVKVMWLDQECEFEATVDYAREVMYRDEVDPMWLQVPFRLLNATSADSQWLNVWGDGEKWVRDRDPIAITENTYGTDRFAALLHAVVDQTFDGPVACLTGVRTEESPVRRIGITTYATYKWATWGKRTPGGNYNLHPIYDWGYTDVWKAIYEHGWTYNRHYDTLYRYGVPVRKMRVSNYFHETALDALFYLQEVEPDTYHRATERISGLSTAGKMDASDYFVYELPAVFSSWREYRDYLCDNLLSDPQVRETMRSYWAGMERRLEEGHYTFTEEQMLRAMVQTIVANDVTMTKLRNFEFAPGHRKASWLREGKPSPWTQM